MRTTGPSVASGGWAAAHTAAAASKVGPNAVFRKLSSLNAVSHESATRRTARWHSAVAQLVSQAHKALQAHSKERDAWKAEADRNTADAKRLKDRLEEMAYKINGLAAGTF